MGGHLAGDNAAVDRRHSEVVACELDVISWIDQTVDQIVKVKMTAKFAPLDFFAWRLSMQLDRPVIDQTKLKGGYDFELSFTQNLPPGVKDGDVIKGAAIDTSGPTVFEAMRKQLGLKLEAQKGPVDIMVIDRVEKPTGD